GGGGWAVTSTAGLSQERAIRIMLGRCIGVPLLSNIMIGRPANCQYTAPIRSVVMPRKIAGPAAAEAKFGPAHKGHVVHPANAGIAEADVIDEVKAEREPGAVEVFHAQAEGDVHRGFADPLSVKIIEAKSLEA